MAGLFDLPTSRNSKEADKKAVNKSTSKKSASTILKGGGIIERISLLKMTVEQKLGKYKDNYDCIRDERVLQTYIELCVENDIVAIDTETTGLDPITDTIVGFSLYTPGQKAVYVPLNHISYVTGIKADNQVSMEFASGCFKLLSTVSKIIMFNAKFDIRVIKNQLGVELSCYFDGYLAGKLLNENEESAGLKALHHKYVLNGEGDAWNFESLFKGIPFDKVPITTGYIYAARDAEITYELYEFQIPYLTKDNPLCVEQGLEKVADVFWNIEMPCMPVLAEIEDTGVAFDLEYANKLSEKYHKIKDENLAEFYDLLSEYEDKINSYKLSNPNHKLSEPLSVSSPTQLAILFYDILGIKPVDQKTPRGTGVEILEKIDNPLCKAILKYRATDKLLSTYIDKLPECINPKTGRIHCSFNQMGAKTGRLSSDNPNLQNIPSHNKDIRKMFVASKGHVMMSCDFSQQEPRAMTAMCGDELMLQSYREGKDLYAQIASLSFNVPYEDCLEFRPDGTTNKEGKERRSSAKSILLGILYGRGIASVAEQLHTTKQNAQKIQDAVFKGFPAIKQFEEDSIYMAEEYGFVTTFWGRKRRLPEMQLPEFEFKYKEGFGDIDPLSFEEDTVEATVPIDIQRFYTNKLHQNPYRKKAIYEEANEEGIWIVDNGGKIADATRQCVNARIQGSAADMSKKAAIIINNNARLKELGFKLLIPIHDEYLAECPIDNVKECAKIFSECMCNAAADLKIPISCDTEITERWYGESIEL